MADFPNNPTVGQQVDISGRIWEWNGVFWAQVPATATSNPNLDSIAATIPQDGDVLQYNGVTNDWEATVNMKKLLLDGGNF